MTVTMPIHGQIIFKDAEREQELIRDTILGCNPCNLGQLVTVPLEFGGVLIYVGGLVESQSGSVRLEIPKNISVRTLRRK